MKAGQAGIFRVGFEHYYICQCLFLLRQQHFNSAIFITMFADNYKILTVTRIVEGDCY